MGAIPTAQLALLIAMILVFVPRADRRDLVRPPGPGRRRADLTEQENRLTRGMGA
jgi:hypothetical protein